MKQIIKINEVTLHKVIKECVMQVLEEGNIFRRNNSVEIPTAFVVNDGDCLNAFSNDMFDERGNYIAGGPDGEKFNIKDCDIVRTFKTFNDAVNFADEMNNEYNAGLYENKRYLKEEDDEYNPWMNGDASFISGNYNIDGQEVEINSRYSYVAIGDDYYFQGDEADDIIRQIAQYWNENDCDQEEAIKTVLSYII